MSINSYLRNLKEEIPVWLRNYHKGDHLNIQDVLNERTLFYPGAGTDGQPVKTFNEAQCVHVFIYVDYGVKRRVLEEELILHGFIGYHLYDSIEIAEKDLTPHGWHPHVIPDHPDPFTHPERPYCFMNIYDRDPEYGEEHGSERFAVIFLYADGHMTYDALYANNQIKAPFALLLQDHGFGGNYDRFGKNGLLNKIANTTNVYPELMLVGNNTSCWDGYTRESEDYVVGGMPAHLRFLYVKNK